MKPCPAPALGGPSSRWGGGGWFRQAHADHGARVGISKSILKQSSQTLYRSCNYEGFHSTPEFNYNRFIPNVLH